MDKNAITGIVLITIMTLVWVIFFSPEPTPPSPDPQSTIAQDSGEVIPAPLDQAEQPVTRIQESNISADLPSGDSSAFVDKYSDFHLLAQGEAATLTVKTEKLTVNLNTFGGGISSVYLNEYKTNDSLPLPVISQHAGNGSFFEFAYSNRAIRSSELYWTPSSAEGFEVSGTDSAVLVMRAAIDEGRYLEQVYTFTGDSYVVGYRIRMVGIAEKMVNSFYDYVWDEYLPKTEMSIHNMRQKSTIIYNVGGDVEKLSFSDDREEEKISTPITWVSYKSQFFSAVLIADEPFRSGSVEMTTPATEYVNRVMKSRLQVVFPRGKDSDAGYRFFFGPNEYSTLRSFDLGLEQSMDMGWWLIRWINVGTTYVFKFLEKYIDNYGIIIIILAVLIRMLILPLTYKSNISMGKMRVINQTPEMKALDEKYKGDQQKLSMAKMKIYKEMGASMFGGCLPMLLSYPFLIALFFFFPQSVELRQQSFLWAHDLSTYDSVLDLPFSIPGYGDHVSLFTLLMAFSTFLFTYYSQQSQPATGANAQMKYITYFMPLILLVFLNSYASGLSLYYLTANLISVAQTLGIRKLVDDEKLLAQMRETQRKKAKGKKGKKGGGKGKLEKWVEKQQKKQEQISKSKKGKGGADNRRSRRS